MPKQEPCRTCGGSRKVLERVSGHFDAGEVEAPCPDCGGKGDGPVQKLSLAAEYLRDIEPDQDHEILWMGRPLRTVLSELLAHTCRQERERVTAIRDKAGRQRHINGLGDYHRGFYSGQVAACNELLADGSEEGSGESEA